MASIIGTLGDDAITPAGVSGGVTGGIPSDADDTIIGLGGNDTIQGGSGHNSIAGGGGDDSVTGGYDYSADNRLYGGAGNDTLVGEGAADYSLAGAAVDVNLHTGIASSDGDGGSDTLIGLNGVYGSAFADRIVASSDGSGPHYFYGGAGNDTVMAGSLGDLLGGGAGNDVMRGRGLAIADYREAAGAVHVNLGEQRATSDGDGGCDILNDFYGVYGSGLDDRIVGSSQDDFLSGYGGNDTLIGLNSSLGDGGEALDGGDGDDLLRGGNGDDLLMGGNGRDVLHGGADNDAMWGDSGNDILFGGEGNDFINSGGFEDNNFNQLYGGVGDDSLSPGGRNDTLRGGDGNDTAYYLHSFDSGLIINLSSGSASGENVQNSLFGIENAFGTNFYDDRIIGNALANSLSGWGGRDHLIGNAGADTLTGDQGEEYASIVGGEDTLRGGDGDDRLFGGRRDDRLVGGAGLDRFVYRERNGGDVIADFENGIDTIEIGGYGAALDSFADLDIRQVGANAQVFLSTSAPLAGVIILPNFDMGDLDATDFSFI